MATSAPPGAPMAGYRTVVSSERAPSALVAGSVNVSEVVPTADEKVARVVEVDVVVDVVGVGLWSE